MTISHLIAIIFGAVLGSEKGKRCSPPGLHLTCIDCSYQSSLFRFGYLLLDRPCWERSMYVLQVFSILIWLLFLISRHRSSTLVTALFTGPEPNEIRNQINPVIYFRSIKNPRASRWHKHCRKTEKYRLQTQNACDATETATTGNSESVVWNSESVVWRKQNTPQTGKIWKIIARTGNVDW